MYSQTESYFSFAFISFVGVEWSGILYELFIYLVEVRQDAKPCLDSPNGRIFASNGIPKVHQETVSKVLCNIAGEFFYDA